MIVNTSKIAIIGGGRVGITAAYAMLLRGIGRSLVLYDRNLDKIKGEQLEFEHALSFLGTTTISATDSFEDIKGSDIIVYTAGAAQEPGESRLDLTTKNLSIMESILPKAVEASPNSIVMLVANPVDILTYRATQLLKLPKGRVFGTGTCLDSARFRFYLSTILGINPKNIHAYILGEHGDSSFPTISNADIGGQPLLTMSSITPQQIQDAYEKTKHAAGTVIAAKGATFYAIGVVIAQLASAILRDTKRVFPVSVLLDGKYGYHHVALSVPCVLGKNGVEHILEVPLSSEEKQKMESSVAVLRQYIPQ